MATSTRQRLERQTPPTRRSAHRPARSLTSRLIRWVCLAAGAALVGGLLGLGLLALADYDVAGNRSPSSSARLAWVWERGDHLHFAVHIAQGRLFDICPCTRRAADYQYFKAHFHALTPHQVQLLSVVATAITAWRMASLANKVWLA
jgi:hypothetical protein